MMTAVQGIIAAGTVAYLTREISWKNVAFTANHLFYLADIALKEGLVEVPYFSLAAKAVFAVTPVLVAVHLSGNKMRMRTKLCAAHLSRFYYLASIVSTVVLVALGHTSYGIGFFSVVALDLAVRHEKVHVFVKEAFGWGAAGAAVLTFASQGARLSTLRGRYLLCVVAAQLILPAVWKILNNNLPRPKGPSSSRRDSDPSDADLRTFPNRNYRFRPDRGLPYTTAALALAPILPNEPSLPTTSPTPGSAPVTWVKNLTGGTAHGW
jgi:hypothetical protein